MKTANEYVSAVDRLLPRWLPNRREHLDELRRHLLDRVAAGEVEATVVGEQEDPRVFALGLVEDIPLDPAPLPARLAAFVIDMLVGIPITVLVLTGLIATVDLLTSVDFLAAWLALARGAAINPGVLLAVSLGLMALTVFVASLTYLPVAEWIWGTTVGKRAFGLAVVTQDGTRLTLGSALVRRIPFLFEFFWLDGLFAFFGSSRQRAFDRVARSLVIRRPDLPRGGRARAPGMVPGSGVAPVVIVLAVATAIPFGAAASAQQEVPISSATAVGQDLSAFEGL